MKITIKDIAKLIGMSTATMFVVINNKTGRISQETKYKMEKLLKRVVRNLILAFCGNNVVACLRN